MALSEENEEEEIQQEEEEIEEQNQESISEFSFGDLIENDDPLDQDSLVLSSLSSVNMVDSQIQRIQPGV